MKFLDFKNIKGDTLGGITAGIVALPLALAFGVQSGLGPSAGLYGAIFIGFFAALFGGTNTQISGPTAPMTAVSMVIVAGIIAANEGDIARALPFILIVFLLAGLIQIAMGMLRLGGYIRYIPYPVVSGFMTAIGLMILFTQMLPVLGYSTQNDTEFIEKFKPKAEEIILKDILDKEVDLEHWELHHLEKTIVAAEHITDEQIDTEAKTLAAARSKGVIGSIRMLPRALKNIRWLEVLLALLTIGIIYGFKKITTKIPSTLVALLVVTGGAYFLNLDYLPIKEIPLGLPLPHFEIFTGFSLSQVSPYIFAALTLAFLGAIDSLLTSVVADNMTKTKHRPNQELIGQGIGNSIAGFFGGIPGAGATIRTVVNIKSGGKTKISGMIAALLLLVVSVFVGPVASKIPAAVLAGILVTVGIGVMDYKGLRAITKMPKDLKIGPIKLSSDVLIMLIVLLLSTFWNLINAVGIGLVIASLIFMKKIGSITAIKSKVIPLHRADELELPWRDELNFPERLKEEVYVKRLDGPLFFGYTSEFQALAKDIPEEATHVIIRLGEMPYMDQSGLYSMEEVLMELHNRGVTPIFTNIQEQPRVMMENIDIIPDLVPEELIFDDFGKAMAWINENVEDTVH